MSSKNIAMVLVRYSIAIAFLSAVADRFGFWGAPGAKNVVWGNYANFLDYTAVLNPWVPKSSIPLVGGLATGLEIIFAVALIIGFKVKEAALASAVLLLIFAVSMALTVGVKAPLDYSVLTASAAAFLLFAVSQSKNK